jgi:putative membrane protein
MKRILFAVCTLAICTVPAIGQKMSGQMSDQKFLDFAAQTDMVEANLGQLAQEQGVSQQVKDYGQTLATDHTQDYAMLQTLAQQAGLTVPTAIDAEHNKGMITPFHQLKGPGFDKKFAHDMAAGHSQAIQVYQNEAKDAQNPAIKSYAQQTLATLQKHLDGAKALQENKSPAM